MTEKIILRLHSNGDLETFDSPLIHSGNIFDNAKTEHGSLNSLGLFDSGPSTAKNLGAKASGFIPVESNKTYNFKAYWDVNKLWSFPGAWAWSVIYSYDSNFVMIKKEVEINTSVVSERSINFTLNENARYIRCVITHMMQDAARGEIKLVGETIDCYEFTEEYIKVPNIIKLPSSNAPSWARDTGNPVSFFKEGIVIKGDLIQTNN